MRFVCVWGGGGGVHFYRKLYRLNGYRFMISDTHVQMIFGDVALSTVNYKGIYNYREVDTEGRGIP